MPAGPTEQFKYADLLTYQSGGGNGTYTFTVAGSNVASGVDVYDIANDPSDNLSQLGDIDPDTFEGTSGGFGTQNLTYYGTTSGGGVVGAAYRNNNTYFFLLRNGASPSGSFTATNTPVAIACFASGTRIRSAHGDVAVESLSVGDLVATSSGALRPIRWIGHRTLDCRRHPRPHEAMPIRIAAHALGENLPARDLFVSPAHSICIDVLGEVLVPACALVNGSTIRQIEAETVTYWHIALDDHDILLAENLPAESYIDMGNARFFEGADVVDLVASPDGDVARHVTAALGRPSRDERDDHVEIVREPLRRA